MAIVFAYRSADFNAYYCGANKLAAKWAAVDANIPTVTADAGAIGGNILNLDKGSLVISQVLFSARRNTPTTGRAISVLCRLKFGTASGNIGVFHIGNELNNTLNSFSFGVLSGQARIVIGNKNAGQCYNANIGAFSPTPGTMYDVVVTWDGTTASNAVKFYVDGTLSAQGTAGNGWDATNQWENIQSIILGALAFDVGTTQIKINEFVIWDTVIDPTSGGLNLNGAARSSFVTVSQFEGDLTDTISAGELMVGTTKNVKGVSITGTYDGSDRWTDPGSTNVRYLTAYKANSLTNNKTGSLVVPDAEDVEIGIVFDNGTVGTLEHVTNNITQMTLMPYGQAAENGVATVTVGDDLYLNVKLMVDSTTPAAISNSSVFTAYIQKQGGGVVTIPNGNFVLLDQIANPGCVKFLTTTYSDDFKLGKKLNIIVKVVENLRDTYFHGNGVLNVITEKP